MKLSLLLGLAATCVIPRFHAAAVPLTYCNPLDLDYGWGGGLGPRHSADPVIVPFQGRYFLFATEDTPGFRVSDDLYTWRRVDFPAEQRALFSDRADGRYCAPAAAADDTHLYFIRMERRRDVKSVPVVRTADPLSGRWEQCGEVPVVKDPALFFDGGRVWLYHGLGQPTKVFEIDHRTWTPIPGSERQVRPKLTDVAHLDGGFERGRRELLGEVDTRAWLNRFTILPCQEAAWMTKHNGRYYLQYATPGTLSAWYCDSVVEGDSPTGPFHPVDYAPVSLKVGGFMGSAGHSSVFQDHAGAWWRATTLWIGVNHLFERRLGLYAVGFDAADRMFTDTELGDYPRRRDSGALAGWWVQSLNATCSASSTLAGHPVANAADEDCRTWWSAATGHAGEWFEMDLGHLRRVNAIQVNFADQDTQPKSLPGGEELQRYKVSGSVDGNNWFVLVDRSAAPGSGPHAYIELPESRMLRRVRVDNVFTPAGGKFSLSDLRVFGHGGGERPAAPAAPLVEGQRDDERNATIRWRGVAGADGYLVRFGVAPDALHHCLQPGSGKTELTTHALTRGVKYYWRIDAFNANGLTVGASPAAAR